MQVRTDTFSGPPKAFTRNNDICPECLSPGFHIHADLVTYSIPVYSLLKSSQIHQNGTPPTPTSAPHTDNHQTALFNFQSLLLVILLTICTSTYAHYIFPGIIDRNKEKYYVSPIWRAARVGERLSPYVSIACVVMAVSNSLFCVECSSEGRGLCSEP